MAGTNASKVFQKAFSELRRLWDNKTINCLPTSTHLLSYCLQQTTVSEPRQIERLAATGIHICVSRALRSAPSNFLPHKAELCLAPLLLLLFFNSRPPPPFYLLNDQGRCQCHVLYLSRVGCVAVGSQLEYPLILVESLLPPTHHHLCYFKLLCSVLAPFLKGCICHFLFYSLICICFEILTE